MSILKLSLVVILISGCISKKSDSNNTPQVSFLSLHNNLISIYGRNLDKISSLKIKTLESTVDLSIESKNSEQVNVSTQSPLRIIARQILELVISTANGTEAIPIYVELPDVTGVTGDKGPTGDQGPSGASSGQTLSFFYIYSGFDVAVGATRYYGGFDGSSTNSSCPAISKIVTHDGTITNFIAKISGGQITGAGEFEATVLVNCQPTDLTLNITSNDVTSTIKQDTSTSINVLVGDIISIKIKNIGTANVTNDLESIVFGVELL